MDPDGIGMEAAMNVMQMTSNTNAGLPPPGPPPGTAPPAETGWDAGKMDPDVIRMSAVMEAMQMMSVEPGMEEMMKEMNKVEEAIPVAPVAEEEKPAPDPAPTPPVVETPQVPEPTPEEKPAPPVEEKVEAPAPSLAPAAEEDDEDESGGPPLSVAMGIAGLLGAAGAGSSPQEKLVRLPFSAHTHEGAHSLRLLGRSCSFASRRIVSGGITGMVLSPPAYCTCLCFCACVCKTFVHPRID